MSARELIRTWTSGRFRLELFDTHRQDWRGQTRLAYRFSDTGKLIFEGADFAGSPLHADDSDETAAALLSFLSLRPGDTDAEHFEHYTPEQLDWCRANGEELGWEASQLEERARSGFVACSVEEHCCAWLVTFDDGSTLLLQTDYDQAAFAVACGAVQAPADWDGLPSKLREAWTEFDASSIEQCPDCYLDVAEQPEGEQ